MPDAPIDRLTTQLADRYRKTTANLHHPHILSLHDSGQGPEQSSGRYLRVVPGWVSRMKAAVDSVGR